MKSNLKQLQNRGFVTGETLDEYRSLSNDALLDLLNSKNAAERTTAAKILGERKIPGSLPFLCESLKTEKKLYTKIAICEAIEKFGTGALKYLLPLVGKIGTNQHKKIDLIDLRKKSYPLPRDIVTRIIIRIGPPALPYLENILEDGTAEQKTEIIDAIGHIAFNHDDYRSKNVLLNAYNNTDDELLKWKIIRAFQSFDSKEIKMILEELLNSNNVIFREEAERSLMQIKKRSARKRI